MRKDGLPIGDCSRPRNKRPSHLCTQRIVQENGSIVLILYSRYLAVKCGVANFGLRVPLILTKGSLLLIDIDIDKIDCAQF